MRFLSTKRHSRAAKPVLLLLALVLVGCVYAFVSPSASGRADTNASTQVARGKEIFQQNCSSCHGLNGEGTTQGPSLAGVGAAAVDFQMGTGRMPMARPEAQAPSKKTKFTDEETASVGAYVASLAPGPKVPSPQSLNTSNLKAEELARGAELFKTNCSACHNIEGRGGALPEGAYAP
ncbi:MAG: cytochrome c, partial [Cutibacterium acnes]|nr:cytochrome c [Cutibacterium acnes]